MKEFTFRTVLIVGAFALAVYLLYPTFADIQNNKDISEKLVKIGEKIRQNHPAMADQDYQKKLLSSKDSLLKVDPSILKNREKRIKLGLDLQGGMYLVMEINTAKLIEKLAKTRDDLFNRLLAETEAETKRSEENVVSVLSRKIKASGQRMTMYFDFGDITATDADIEAKLREQENDAVTRAVEVISKRVNQYGVSEPNIQQQGRRIVLELPGISNPEEARTLVQKGAVLEFTLLPKPQAAVALMTRIDQILAGTDSTKKAADTTANQTPEQFAKQHPFFALAQFSRDQRNADAVVRKEDKQKLLDIFERADVKKVMEDAGIQFLFDAKWNKDPNSGNEYTVLYALNAKPELTGEIVTDALATIDQQSNRPAVTMDMNDEGAAEWARITGQNVGERCAIVLDGVVYSAPVIEERIPNGQSRISGSETMEEAKLLEIVLKAGALPAPVVTIEERTIGPSLGQDSVNQGFNSFLYGFILVSLFMIVYYRNGGIISFVGLFFTILTLLGILAAFHGVLTLPGIAGIVLTIGMAVDANVLIYERIREELLVGKTLKAAVDSGFTMSLSAILDSNVTTLITGIILYQFGTGAVQGFALTLMIGILCSMFSALVFSRLVFDYFISKGYKINLG